MKKIDGEVFQEGIKWTGATWDLLVNEAVKTKKIEQVFREIAYETSKEGILLCISWKLASVEEIAGRVLNFSWNILRSKKKVTCKYSASFFLPNIQ